MAEGIKTLNMKEKIMNSLEGKFEVTKVEREDWDNGVGLICEFMKGGKVGSFTSTLEGGERGADYVEWDNKDDEDIHGEIAEWVSKNIDWRVIVKFKGKELI